LEESGNEAEWKQKCLKTGSVGFLFRLPAELLVSLAQSIQWQSVNYLKQIIYYLWNGSAVRAIGRAGPVLCRLKYRKRRL